MEIEAQSNTINMETDGWDLAVNKYESDDDDHDNDGDDNNHSDHHHNGNHTHECDDNEGDDEVDNNEGDNGEVDNNEGDNDEVNDNRERADDDEVDDNETGDDDHIDLDSATADLIVLMDSDTDDLSEKQIKAALDSVDTGAIVLDINSMDYQTDKLINFAMENDNRMAAQAISEIANDQPVTETQLLAIEKLMDEPVVPAVEVPAPPVVSAAPPVVSATTSTRICVLV